MFASWEVQGTDAQLLETNHKTLSQYPYDPGTNHKTLTQHPYDPGTLQTVYPLESVSDVQSIKEPQQTFWVGCLGSPE